MVASSPAKRGARRMLRIVSKCSSHDEFVAIFKRFCDDSSIFIVTKTPKEVGARSRFLITLAGGEPMLAGLGEVSHTYADGSSPLGRPGMRLRFEELDDSSRATLEALKQARNALNKKPPPTPILPRVPSKIPAIPGPPAVPGPRAGTGPAPTSSPLAPADSPLPSTASADAERAAQAEAEALAEAEEALANAPPAETRAAGGSLILPANPFGDLTEESLEAFIECTMYEESGLLEGLPDDERSATNTDGTVPAWWPKETEDPTKVDGAPAAAEPPYRIESPAAAAALRAPTGADMPMHGPAGQPHAVPMAPPVAQHAPAPGVVPPRYDPTELVPMYQARPAWQKTAVIAGIASVMSLGIGYAVWGGGDNGGQEQLSGEPATKTTESDANTASKEQATDDSRPGVRAAIPTKDDAGGTEPAKSPGSDVPPANTPPAADDDDDSNPDDADTKDAANAIPAAAAVEPPSASDGDSCKLSVVTKPEGATVTVGGKSLGTSPATVTAPCGAAPLRLDRVRYVTEERALNLVPGKINKVVVRFKRPTHTLRVSSVPAGATAFVNGRRIGKTPAATKVRGYERASIKLTRPGYNTWSSKVYTSRKVHSVRGTMKRLRRRRR